MENSQEHKIDKIFRETFENQSFTPPTDAWMGIHTYTIGQEESKQKVWLRYASLALLFLLVSGFGLWYFVDNQVVKLANDSSSHAPVAGLPTSPLVRKHTQKSILPTTGIAVTSISPSPTVQRHTSTLLTPEVVSGDTDHGGTFSHEVLVTNNDSNIKDNKLAKKEPLIIELVDDSLMNDEIEFAEPVCYFNQYKIEEIDSKPLILNDLTEKMQKKSEKKIVALEEKSVDKKEVYKSDSVVYGDGFSLKHPIISYGLGGTRSFWDFGGFLGIENNGLSKKNLPSYYVANGSILKISIAWKINKKLRIGVGLSANTFNLGIPYRRVNITNDTVRTDIYLFKEFAGKSYTTFTPFGFLNIPTASFNNFPTDIPNTLDSVRTLRYPYSHSMRVTTLSISSQYNLLSKNRKKGKRYGYQIYGLVDYTIQRQTGYSYAALDEKEFLNGLSFSPIRYKGYIFQEGNHLENSTEYTFGLRLGLGFRYQFARKWDLYLEGSGQSNFNSWIKETNLNQRAISLQAGINLNL
jgi:hypothetical protein